VLYGFIFPLYRITDILIAGSISIIIYYICSRLIPKKRVLQPEKFVIRRTGIEETDQAIEKGKEYIDRLMELYQEISVPEMKEQIEKLSTVSRKIFDFVTEHPDTTGQLRSFMNYYFPTTIKLLEDYRDIAKEEIQGQNIQTSLAKINNIMKVIEKSFYSQLDDLYQNKALDIAADIAVLESLLASEGLQGGIKG